MDVGSADVREADKLNQVLKADSTWPAVKLGILLYNYTQNLKLTQRLEQKSLIVRVPETVRSQHLQYQVWSHKAYKNTFNKWGMGRGIFWKSQSFLYSCFWKARRHAGAHYFIGKSNRNFLNSALGSIYIFASKTKQELTVKSSWIH